MEREGGRGVKRDNQLLRLALDIMLMCVCVCVCVCARACTVGKKERGVDSDRFQSSPRV